MCPHEDQKSRVAVSATRAKSLSEAPRKAQKMSQSERDCSGNSDPERELGAGCQYLVDVGRRNFLKKVALAAATVAAVPKGIAQTAGKSAANMFATSPAQAGGTYPVTRLGNLKDLKVNTPVQITYPDAASPGVLLKLGNPVEAGAGPDGDVVAFSTLCAHKGYPLNYNASSRTLNCPGHYSVYDVEKGGLEVWGHAAQNLAQFKLRIDQATGDIYGIGVDELIYGRTGNVLA
jgi:arsenite oxidase small subunit